MDTICARGPRKGLCCLHYHTESSSKVVPGVCRTQFNDKFHDHGSYP